MSLIDGLSESTRETESVNVMTKCENNGYVYIGHKSIHVFELLAEVCDNYDSHKHEEYTRLITEVLMHMDVIEKPVIPINVRNSKTSHILAECVKQLSKTSDRDPTESFSLITDRLITMSRYNPAVCIGKFKGAQFAITGPALEVSGNPPINTIYNKNYYCYAACVLTVFLSEPQICAKIETGSSKWAKLMKKYIDYMYAKTPLSPTYNELFELDEYSHFQGSDPRDARTFAEEWINSWHTEFPDGPRIKSREWFDKSPVYDAEMVLYANNCLTSGFVNVPTVKQNRGLHGVVLYSATAAMKHYMCGIYSHGVTFCIDNQNVPESEPWTYGARMLLYSNACLERHVA